MSRAAAPLQWLAMGLLALALVAVPWSQLLGALAIGLGVLTALKLAEARQVRERRLVGLLQLFSAWRPWWPWRGCWPWSWGRAWAGG